MNSLLRFLFYAVFIRLIVLIILGLNVRHREGLPKAGPAIIVANHNSHLDAVSARIEACHRIGGRVTYGLVSAFVILFASVAEPAEPRWPGAAPDCWVDARFTHSQDMLDIWKDRTRIRRVRDIKPNAGTYSPNNGYYFTLEGGRPTGSVTIYAEKDYLLRIEFSELFGLAEVKWLNEKLLFMRPWWGRILGTDLIYDVEAERIVYVETVTDGYLAYQQFRESCPILGCDCIKKKAGS